MSVMNRANSLAIYELLGDVDMMNTELDKYRAVTAAEMLEASRRIFDPLNSNTLVLSGDGIARTINSEK